MILVSFVTVLILEINVLLHGEIKANVSEYFQTEIMATTSFLVLFVTYYVMTVCGPVCVVF